MSRYAAMFERLAERQEGALGAFLMLGDPDMENSYRLLKLIVEAGADMIEVGFPFSDPVADGPVIQAAAQRALNAGVKIAHCFGLIARLRESRPDVPIGILTYANLVLARGREHFFRASADAGADSLLVADLPVLEAEPWITEMREARIAPVLIAAANTPPDRLKRIARLSQGYVYCVSRVGITGVHAPSSFDPALVGQLAAAGSAPPVFGFGISTPGQVRAALVTGAAGVISGSAIVDCAFRGADVGALVKSLKTATRNEK